MLGREKEIRSGCTLRSFFIILYAILVFTPVSIWLSISVGVTGGLTYYMFAILMIAIELSRFYGKPLTKQEVATIMVALSGLSWGAGIEVIKNAYFSSSNVLDFFNLRGKIPFWLAPPPESSFYISRSFFHPWYINNLLIPRNLLAMLVPGAATFAGLSLGILNKILFVDVEKLPYPGVQVQAEFCETLTEREPARLSVFSIAFAAAFLYSVFVYTFPNITGIKIVPMLWIDMSPEIQRFLPGACFGIATDPITLTPAFYLPLYVILCQLIGSISLWVFGNWYVVSRGLTEFSKIYIPKMEVQHIYLWSNLYVWMMPLTGFSIVAGLLNFRPDVIRRAIFSLKKKMSTVGGERLFSIWLIIVPFTGMIIISLITIWYWAPDYPMWPWFPLLYSVSISISGALLAGRAAGTGISATIPEGLDRIILVAANYQGFNAWFVRPAIVGYSFGGPVDQNFKLAQLTESSFTGFLKLFFLVWPLSTVVSLIFTQIFWSLAQIPSEYYPWSATIWPMDVIKEAVWVTKPPEIFHLDWMIMGGGICLVIFTILSLLHLPANTIIVSLVSGMNMLPPFAMNLLIGYFVRLALERIMGKETFNKYKFTLMAGIVSGSGLSIALGVGFMLIIKSISPVPY